MAFLWDVWLKIVTVSKGGLHGLMDRVISLLSAEFGAEQCIAAIPYSLRIETIPIMLKIWNETSKNVWCSQDLNADDLVPGRDRTNHTLVLSTTRYPLAPLDEAYLRSPYLIRLIKIISLLHFSKGLEKRINCVVLK